MHPAWRFMRKTLLGALMAAGCRGSIGPGGSEPGVLAPGPEDTGSMGGTPRLPADHPGPMPLRRLTRDELNNPIRDLLGDDSAPARVLPLESNGLHGFLEAGTVSTVDVEHLLDFVAAVGAGAAKTLPALIACDNVAM